MGERKLPDVTFRKDKKLKKPSKKVPLKNPSVDQTLRKEFDSRKPDDRTVTNDSFIITEQYLFTIPTICVLLSSDRGSNDASPLPQTKRAVELMSADDRPNKPLDEVVPLFNQEYQLYKKSK